MSKQSFAQLELSNRKQELGKALRRLLKECCSSQREMAEFAQISKGSVGQIINERYDEVSLDLLYTSLTEIGAKVNVKMVHNV